jgi:hypothetical protein
LFVHELKMKADSLLPADILREKNETPPERRTPVRPGGKTNTVRADTVIGVPISLCICGGSVGLSRSRNEIFPLLRVRGCVIRPA